MPKLVSLIAISLCNFSISFNAFAQEQGAGEPPSQIIVLILLFVIMYFFLIRPQSKKQKALTTMISALEKGDVIITTGGVTGVIKKSVDGDQFFEVEISPSVSVNVLKTSVLDKVSKDHSEYKKLSKMTSSSSSTKDSTKKSKAKNKKSAE